MVRSRRVHLALILLPATLITACHKMGPVTPSDYITTNQPTWVLVTEADGEVSVFQGPKMVGDTLTGFVRGEYRELHLSNVKEVAARQPHRKKTILSLAAGALITGGLLYLISGSGPGASDIPADEDEVPN